MEVCQAAVIRKDKEKRRLISRVMRSYKILSRRKFQDRAENGPFVLAASQMMIYKKRKGSKNT
jgi:hypothetical protein